MKNRKRPAKKKNDPPTEGREKEMNVFIDLDDIRPAGESLKGFGGMANPVKLNELYTRVTALLNKAISICNYYHCEGQDVSPTLSTF